MSAAAIQAWLDAGGREEVRRAMEAALQRSRERNKLRNAPLNPLWRATDCHKKREAQ